MPSISLRAWLWALKMPFTDVTHFACPYTMGAASLDHQALARARITARPGPSCASLIGCAGLQAVTVRRASTGLRCCHHGTAPTTLPHHHAASVRDQRLPLCRMGDSSPDTTFRGIDSLHPVFVELGVTPGRHA